MQTHRDPLNVISSIGALTHHLRRMASDDRRSPSARGIREEIVVGLERGMTLRDSDAMAARQVVDVQFADFVADPFTAIR